MTFRRVVDRDGRLRPFFPAILPRARARSAIRFNSIDSTIAHRALHKASSTLRQRKFLGKTVYYRTDSIGSSSGCSNHTMSRLGMKDAQVISIQQPA
jgi:hypothetical protein